MNSIGGPAAISPAATQQSAGAAGSSGEPTAEQQQAAFEQEFLIGAITTSGFITFGKAQELVKENINGITED